MDASEQIRRITSAARAAAAQTAVSSGEQRDDALRACGAALRESAGLILAENKKDIDASGESGLGPAMVRRLTLDEEKITKMAAALDEMAAQVDPVGKTIAACNRPNGLRVEKRRVPIGVIGIIYESRPNVTSDAAGLCIKSGNACILRGGKESLHSNLAVAAAVSAGLTRAGLPGQTVQVLDSTDRALVPAMATARGLIDLIIPRGGTGLIRAVTEAAVVPVIKHYDGICHVYVHRDADLDDAASIVMNAKCQHPGVCNAMETLLVDGDLAERFLPAIAQKLGDAGVEMRGCSRSRELADMKAASEEDWGTEYLAPILSIRVVDGLAAAIEHINTYGSNHTDAIVTSSIAAADRFTAAVDSSSVMVNASTRFSDGGEYGLGAEIGISTDKLHARGPMGAEDLTTYKWIVTGTGHVRE